MAAEGITSYNSWDFHNLRVHQDLVGGQFVSAETTLVAAGPSSLQGPTITDLDSSTDVYPIGLLESFGIQQNRQLQRIFEIGSTRSYFIPGRTIGSIALGRTFFFGPSLLRALYARYAEAGASAAGTKVTLDSGIEITDPKAQLVTGADDFMTPKRTPGFDNFYIDLASDLFAQPCGMAVYFKDMLDNTVGGFYLQECYVQGHQLTINSGSVLIMEGAQLQYDRLHPIQFVTPAPA